MRLGLERLIGGGLGKVPDVLMSLPCHVVTYNPDPEELSGSVKTMAAGIPINAF